MALSKNERRIRIKRRIRKKISGTPDRMRVSVFRSNKEIYVQLIDDLNGETKLQASSREKEIESIKGTKIQKAEAVGKLFAQRANESGIKEIVFDRNGYLYHGRVKALAEAIRKNGLKF